ncbi:MAG: 5-formyltetrahydrofolate cyclo-ligase [Clostridia bacterium]|nr:5-formyltetrahydrofolate cyclo-ligase [Clostridia bacterium]
MAACEGKAWLRRSIRGRFPGDEARRAESERLCRHVMDWDCYRRASAAGLYIPLAWEADVMAILRHALRSGKTVALPRVEDQAHMTMRQMRSMEELVPGRWGIAEPSPEALIVPCQELELLIVPLEGIDRRGVRLGKGGGYYDRLIAQMHGMTLGAAMSWQWEESIPQDKWDVPLKAAADQNGIVLF